MSDYRNFAVWGAGNFGTDVVAELLALQPAGRVASVIVLTRIESKENAKNQGLEAQGAHIVPYAVDGEDPVSALRGVDVLISTTGAMGHALQPALLRAAKTAGVRLFVPAEFGDIPDHFAQARPYASMLALRAQAAELSMPTATFANGRWAEMHMSYGFDLSNGKISIPGDGTAPMSLTSRHDAARFIAHALTALPRIQIEDTRFQIEGERTTWNDLVSELQKLSPKSLQISYTPASEFERRLKENPSDILALIRLGWTQGLGALPGPLSNDLWSEWKPKRAIDVLRPVLEG